MAAAMTAGPEGIQQDRPGTQHHASKSVFKTTSSVALHRGKGKHVFRHYPERRFVGGTLMDSISEAFHAKDFQIAFLKKKGTAFQDWFMELAGHAFGSDF